MKHLKLLTIAGIAAMALMAFVASSASATTLTDGTGVLKTGSSIDASLTGGETAKLESGSTILDECSGGTVEAVTANETGSSITGTVAAKDLTWSGCTHTTTTLHGGALTFTYTTDGNAMVSATGFEVTVNTIVGSCVYGFGTSFHNIGGLFGGSPADIFIDTKVTSQEPKNLFCPAEPVWTANYVVTSPSTLLATS